MKCFVISLHRAVERRKRFFYHATRHGWTVEVFYAVDKADLVVRETGPASAEVTHIRDANIRIAAVAGSWGKLSLASGHYACALSHMLLWKRLLHEGTQCCCIFEDDALIERPFDAPPLPDDADFVFLSDRVSALVPDEVTMQSRFAEWCQSNPYLPLVPGCGTEAYIVTPRGAEKGLKLMQPMYWPIDLQLMSYGHGTVAAGNALAKERRTAHSLCRIYVSTQTYTRHEDQGVSYLNK